MAKLNITLDQDEILSLLEQDRDGAFLELMRGALNGILRAESERQLHAAPSERTPGRTDYRNGTRTRTLKTRIGAIELDVPRHRNTPFRTLVFDNYQRSEAALVATMAQMVVEGVSTRKVAAVVEELCGQAPSKSQVSEVCARLDGDVERFRSLPRPGRVPFLSVDATYFKVRGGGPGLVPRAAGGVRAGREGRAQRPGVRRVRHGERGVVVRVPRGPARTGAGEDRSWSCRTRTRAWAGP